MMKIDKTCRGFRSYSTSMKRLTLLTLCSFFTLISCKSASTPVDSNSPADVETTGSVASQADDETGTEMVESGGRCLLSQANPDDLELLRGQNQQEFNAPGTVLEAAERVFESAPMTGCLAAEVERVLGTPFEQRSEGSNEFWTYMFHDGEQGRSRRLTIEDGRVVSVDVILTQ